MMRIVADVQFLRKFFRSLVGNSRRREHHHISFDFHRLCAEQRVGAAHN